MCALSVCLCGSGSIRSPSEVVVGGQERQLIGCGIALLSLYSAPRRTTTTWMAQLGKSPIHFLLPPCVYLRAPPELGWPDKKWFSVVSRGNIQSTLTWGDDGQIVFGLWVHLIPVVAMELFRRGFTRIKSDLLSLLRLVWRSAWGFLQTTIYV